MMKLVERRRSEKKRSGNGKRGNRTLLITMYRVILILMQPLPVVPLAPAHPPTMGNLRQHLTELTLTLSLKRRKSFLNSVSSDTSAVTKNRLLTFTKKRKKGNTKSPKTGTISVITVERRNNPRMKVVPIFLWMVLLRLSPMVCR